MAGFLEVGGRETRSFGWEGEGEEERRRKGEGRREGGREGGWRGGDWREGGRREKEREGWGEGGGGRGMKGRWHAISGCRLAMTRYCQPEHCSRNVMLSPMYTFKVCGCK